MRVLKRIASFSMHFSKAHFSRGAKRFSKEKGGGNYNTTYISSAKEKKGKSSYKLDCILLE
jgi:hypothetical protein